MDKFTIRKNKDYKNLLLDEKINKAVQLGAFDQLAKQAVIEYRLGKTEEIQTEPEH